MGKKTSLNIELEYFIFRDYTQLASRESVDYSFSEGDDETTLQVERYRIHGNDSISELVRNHWYDYSLLSPVIHDFFCVKKFDLILKFKTWYIRGREEACLKKIRTLSPIF